jgi:hypothetical protein
MEMFLRCAVHDRPRKWRRWSRAAEFWYNSTTHASLICSSFKALYGQYVNSGAMLLWQGNSILATELDRELYTTQLRDHLLIAQHRFKKKADKNKTEREFQVGDVVLLKLQPYAQSTVSNRLMRTSLPHYYLRHCQLKMNLLWSSSPIKFGLDLL